MKLRQCVFVTKDLESSREELCDILGIEVAYRDPGVAKWGLVNVVCPTGHDFLEIVTPVAAGHLGRPLHRAAQRRRRLHGDHPGRRCPGRAQARHRSRRPRRGAEGPAGIPVHALPPGRHVGRAAVARHDLRAHGRRSRAVVAAGREGLAEARALRRHQRTGRRRDPARRSRQGGGDLVEDPRSSGRGQHHPPRRLARRRPDPLRARSSTAAARACRPTTSGWSTASASWRPPTSAASKLGPAQVEVCGCRINLV